MNMQQKGTISWHYCHYEIAAHSDVAANRAEGCHISAYRGVEVHRSHRKASLQLIPLLLCLKGTCGSFYCGHDPHITWPY